MTNARIIQAMAHRERGMNVTALPCRRRTSVFLGAEHSRTLPRLDVSRVMIRSTVLTKRYYSTMHATGPGVRKLT